ncbi:muramoyltetrapeptide carboxypeptidase [Pullulanibacillus pueri]|uniref:Peptidase S66 n=1 Tax=Pullulanibacillus pueri TaxID=1437324 RepID=A0A8J3EKX1_9BACL|nr:LD-carboxypeptidase [Pullulanibacillus pueri]MBM7681126.1 muramoyltetrapeptide carboxypeptidase [Pullulanibacillus pueri]GGH77145.1 peptidase S66 [Pullulanibacillus pueri]
MATKPPILQQGDTIGIVTLGSPLAGSSINQGIRRLQSMGFHVVIGQHAYAQTGFLAGSDEERAADLMGMFYNNNVKMIISSRGGVGVAGILPHLDFDYIRSHPKIVSGYSDVTILLNCLYQFSDLVSFSSLLLLDFASTLPSYNINQFFAATSMAAPRPIENPPGMPLVSRVAGNVTGPIVGGNLTSFVGTLGTPFEIDTSGKILFLEETHEPINKVYRYFNQLKMAGKFDDCIGILLGECTECTPAYYTSYEDLINDVIVPLGKPLMTNLTAAHGYYKAAIPIGAVANLNTTNNTLTITEPTVSASY